MAKYGNILTILNGNDNIHSQVETVLSDNQTVYVKLKDTFYVETNSIKNTGEVIKNLNVLDIEFIFFHNQISDGSLIRSKGIDQDKMNTINMIMFK